MMPFSTLNRTFLLWRESVAQTWPQLLPVQHIYIRTGLAISKVWKKFCYLYKILIFLNIFSYLKSVLIGRFLVEGRKTVLILHLCKPFTDHGRAHFQSSS